MEVKFDLESIGRLRKLRRETPEEYKEFLKDLTEIMYDLEEVDNIVYERIREIALDGGFKDKFEKNV